MFDDIDLGSDSGGGAFTISDGYGDLGYDTSGLGNWVDYSGGLPASTWGAEPPSSYSLGYAAPAQGALSLAAAEAPASTNQSVLGSKGYDNSGTGSYGSKIGQVTPPEQKSLISQAGDLLKDGKGNYDISKIIKLGVGLGNLLGTKQQTKQASSSTAGATTAAQLAAQLARQQSQAWTPQQSQWANSFFQAPTRADRGVQYASEMRSPIVASRGYAGGGGIGAVGDGRYGAPPPLPALPPDVNRGNIFQRTRARNEHLAGLEDYTSTPMQRGTERVLPQQRVPISDLLDSLPKLFRSLGFRDDAPPTSNPYARGGEVIDVDAREIGPGALSQTEPFVGYVEGDTGGQSDLIDAKLAAGEYVWDADTVSAIGDGNNAAGAEKLDQMREQIRAHKRSAPPDEIPPPMADMGEE